MSYKTDKLSLIQNGSKREINAYFRANDESNLWPICNRFDATERAIRRIRCLDDGCLPLSNGGLEYFLALDAEITRIVNAAI